MPVSFEIAPICWSRSLVSIGEGNFATVVTSVPNPVAAHAVHAGAFQFLPKSAVAQNFTAGEFSGSGYVGTASVPQGGCGPDCAAPQTRMSRVAAITSTTLQHR